MRTRRVASSDGGFGGWRGRQHAGPGGGGGIRGLRAPGRPDEAEHPAAVQGGELLASSVVSMCPLFGMLDILALTREWHLIKADNVKTSTSLCDGLFNTKYRLPGNLILRGITAPGPGCGFLMGLQCMPIDSWGCLQVKYVRELTRQFVILKQQRLFSENAQRIPVSHSQGFAGGKK